jgi:hypothetical protein
MDNPLTPEKQHAMIEDALHTYPVTSMPRDITADVMARIEVIPAPRPFRLTWQDVAISVVVFLCVGAIWFSLNNMPPLVMAQIRKESILLSQKLIVNARWLVPLVFFSLAGLFGALTIPYLRQELSNKSA